MANGQTDSDAACPADVVHIVVNGDRELDCPAGTRVASLAPPPPEPDAPYIAARVNNDIASLSYPLSVNSRVHFLTMADSHGWRVYRNSLCFLLAKAVRDLFPDARFSVEHSFGVGLYCSFHPDPQSDDGMTKTDLDAVGQHMRELVSADMAIDRHKVSYCDAVDALRQAGLTDKLNLLRHRNPPRIVMHCCGTFSDLAHGPLVPSTGVLGTFALRHYPPGFILLPPERTAPHGVPDFRDQPHLFAVLQQHKEWGRIVGVNTVGRLNAIITRRTVDDFVWTSEALHEKRLSRIADDIAADRKRVRLVLIAGPSCSGKTTFAKRLSTHLMVNGLQPVTLATDDYFVGQDRNPRDAEGNPDYEHVEAVDLELFNQHLVDLIAGKAIARPSFDFTRKARKPDRKPMHLAENQILIVEGIHALNPILARMVPADQKFRIYVSALTQLAVDSNNRIPTTDNRLIRRLVRDHKYRGHSALFTLQLWPSVRRGEKRWIFPYQNEADAAFNSALDYELAVLKPLVEPLLMEVKPDRAEYAEARRLTEFLLNFLATDSRAVPGTSILREYIGGSRLRY